MGYWNIFLPGWDEEEEEEGGRWLWLCRVKPGYDVIGSIVVFVGIWTVSRSTWASGIFFNELGPKGSLQDGEECLVVDGFHDQGGAGLIAVWEGEVVDAHTIYGYTARGS
jgi:hypothetical protein